MPVAELADGFFVDQAFERLHRRAETIVLRDDELLAGFVGELHHQLGVFQVIGDRFFRQQVQAALKGELGVLHVNRGRGDGEDGVGLHLAQRLTQVVEAMLGLDLHLLAGFVEHDRVDVDKGDDVEVRRIGRGVVPPRLAHPADAALDQAQLVHSEPMVKSHVRAMSA